MKVGTRIKYAVWHMRQARAAWEKERSLNEAQPLLLAAADKPEVHYMPGLGWSIDGVVWQHDSAYIIEDHEKRTRDYQQETRRMQAERGVMEEVNDPSDIPF